MAQTKTDEATAYAQAVVKGKIIAGPHVRNACKRHLDDLKNGKKRGLYWDVEAVKRILGFCRDVLRLSEGQFDGVPFNPEPSQAFILGSLFGWKRPDGTRRYRRAYIEQGKGNGKALALDTPLPTPSGWTTMGAVREGDELFDEDGAVCRVVQVHPVSSDRECYRLTFDDGETITASAEHLWYTEKRSASALGEPRATKGVPKSEWGAWRKGIRTTAEIAESLTYKNGKYQSANHSIPLAGALGGPDVDLPVPPYVLGAWLGDGDSDCARMTCAFADQQVIREIEAEGQPTRQQKKHSLTTGRFALSAGNLQKQRDASLGSTLRRLGLLGNKHIPKSYLRASAGQRLALLQGLMDTDGTIAESGQCEFSVVSERLAADTHELIVSLGIKARMRMSDATLNGRIVGVRYRINFFPSWDRPVFRLERKAERQVVHHSRRRLSADRRIVHCERVESVPVRCITVDAPSSMFLAGRNMVPTHNSPMAGTMGVYGLVADGESGAEIYAAGATKDQAGILFRDAVKMVRQSPALSSWITPSGGPGREYNLAHLKSGSFFRPVSRETKKTGSGPRPHMALCDELHEHPDGGVIEILERGFKFRRQPLLLMITNSGTDRQSICWEERKHAVAVAAQEIEDDSAFSYVCALDEGDDPLEDPSCWIKANPLLGVTIQEEYLAGVVKQARSMPSKRNGILRLHFCVWTDSDTAWIEKEAWESCIDPEMRLTDFLSEPCTVGLDLSMSRDMTARALVFHDGETEDGQPKYAAFAKGYLPEGSHERLVQEDGEHWQRFAETDHLEIFDGKTIRTEDVAQQLVELGQDYEIEGVAYDRHLFPAFEQYLIEMGADFPLVEHGQGFNRGPEHRLWMPESINTLEKLILEGRIRIEANPVLGYAAFSAVAEESAAGLRRFSKQKAAKSKIDMLVALTMAVGAATHGEGEKRAPSIWETLAKMTEEERSAYR